MTRRLILPLLLRLLAACLIPGLLTAPAHALDTVELNRNISTWALQPQQLELFEDPQDTIRLSDILQGRAAFRPVQQAVINLGPSDSSIWVHLRLRDNSQSLGDNTWILELAFARLARVDLYLLDGGVLKSQTNIGYDLPLSVRELSHNFFAQPLRPEPGRVYDLYLNVMRKGGGIQIPLTLRRSAEFSRYVAERNQFYGMYFGIMLAMFIYNLFLLMSVGNRAYLYYILHIAGTFTTFQILNGYAFQHWWPETPIINEYAIQFSVCLAGMASLLFLRHYVGLHQHPRWMNRSIDVMLLLGPAIIAFRLLTDNPTIIAAGLYISSVSVQLFTLAFVAWRQGSRPAGYYLLAWSLFLGGALLHLFTLLGWLPNHFITTYAVIIGSAIEVLLLSLGLADRINEEKRARYLALQEKHIAILELKEAEARLVQRALHSATTGLPNRALLRSVLEQTCARRQDPERISLVLINLNNFHEFNKTLGHSNGDAILGQIAERLREQLIRLPSIIALETSADRIQPVACIEGVTFAVLLRDQSDAAILSFAQHTLEQIEVPFEFQGLSLNLNASIGISTLPQHGNNAEELLRNAHIAQEMAANSGSGIALYSRDMDPYNARRISLLAELRSAIDADQLQLYLQPQIALADRRVVGAEVLIRWPHAEHGFIPPAEFIPLAERTGVIHPLTYWVCRKTFALARQLRVQGQPLMLSINISARNLQAADFTLHMTQLAAEAGIDLHHITLELTETAMMREPDEALRVMQALAATGVRLSVDDFGTGYSSLAYLKKLPVDEIKIDRSFIQELQGNDNDLVIVQTTLLMGHNLGLDVVAEGIENATTLEQLTQLGCDRAQGYHIARPMPVEDFRRWLVQYSTPPAASAEAHQ